MFSDGNVATVIAAPLVAEILGPGGKALKSAIKRITSSHTPASGANFETGMVPTNESPVASKLEGFEWKGRAVAWGKCQIPDKPLVELPGPICAPYIRDPLSHYCAILPVVFSSHILLSPPR
jgi:hypothetical protein